MANWKTGWCVGDEIENICSQSVSEDYVSHEDYYHNNNLSETKNHLGDILRFIGNKDSDIVYLLFISKKKQNDICKLLRKTQPAISYDVGRIKRQIDFIVYLLSVVDEFIEFIQYDEHGLNSFEMDMLILLFFSSSFNKTAEVLGYHQITCRNRVSKIIKKLEDRGYNNIVDIFDVILSNLNKVKKNVFCEK